MQVPKTHINEPILSTLANCPLYLDLLQKRGLNYKQWLPCPAISCINHLITAYFALPVSKDPGKTIRDYLKNDINHIRVVNGFLLSKEPEEALFQKLLLDPVYLRTVSVAADRFKTSPLFQGEEKLCLLTLSSNPAYLNQLKGNRLPILKSTVEKVEGQQVLEKLLADPMLFPQLGVIAYKLIQSGIYVDQEIFPCIKAIAGIHSDVCTGVEQNPTARIQALPTNHPVTFYKACIFLDRLTERKPLTAPLIADLPVFTKAAQKAILDKVQDLKLRPYDHYINVTVFMERFESRNNLQILGSEEIEECEALVSVFHNQELINALLLHDRFVLQCLLEKMHQVLLLKPFLTDALEKFSENPRDFSVPTQQFLSPNIKTLIPQILTHLPNGKAMEPLLLDKEAISRALQLIKDNKEFFDPTVFVCLAGVFCNPQFKVILQREDAVYLQATIRNLREILDSLTSNELAPNVIAQFKQNLT